MVHKTLTGIIFIIVFFLMSFIVWHFFISIYEVKYHVKFPSDHLTLNSDYYIQFVGLNSLGWEISFRDLEINIKLENEDKVIEILDSKRKNIFRFRTKRIGDFTFLASSKYSLNPTRFAFTVKK